MILHAECCHDLALSAKATNAEYGSDFAAGEAGAGQRNNAASCHGELDAIGHLALP